MLGRSAIKFDRNLRRGFKLSLDRLLTMILTVSWIPSGFLKARIPYFQGGNGRERTVARGRPQPRKGGSALMLAVVQWKLDHVRQC
jgi:hypothetical protein